MSCVTIMENEKISELSVLSYPCFDYVPVGALLCCWSLCWSCGWVCILEFKIFRYSTQTSFCPMSNQYRKDLYTGQSAPPAEPDDIVFTLFRHRQKRRLDHNSHFTKIGYISLSLTQKMSIQYICTQNWITLKNWALNLDTTITALSAYHYLLFGFNATMPQY